MEALKTALLGLAVLFFLYVVLAVLEALPALPLYQHLAGGH